MQYSITVLFNNSDLPTLYEADLKLCMSKGTVTQPGSDPSSLIWIAADPFQSNVVTWEETYNLFVSNEEVMAGAKIVQLGNTTGGIDVGLCYEYKKGVFGPTGSAIPVPNGFTVQNHGGASYMFGLSQSQVVDGVTVSSPIMANIVPNNYVTTFFPTEPLLYSCWLVLRIQHCSEYSKSSVTSVSHPNQSFGYSTIQCSNGYICGAS